MEFTAALASNGEIVTVTQVDSGRVNCVGADGEFRAAFRNVFSFGGADIVSEVLADGLEMDLRGRLTAAAVAVRRAADLQALIAGGIAADSLSAWDVAV